MTKRAVPAPARGVASTSNAKPGRRLPSPGGRGRGPARRDHAAAVYQALAALYPDAHCALHYRSPFELLVATILSAQCTDERVNKVTPALFEAFPTPAALAAAAPARLESLIRSTGFYRNKARNLRGAAAALVADHGGEVPASMQALVALPGVARKTANVVLGDAFGQSVGVTVDTHVTRLSERLGLTRERDAVKIERDLMALFSPESWRPLPHLLITHGRRVCVARRPRCDGCGLAALCPRIGVELRDRIGGRKRTQRPRPHPGPSLPPAS